MFGDARMGEEDAGKLARAHLCRILWELMMFDPTVQKQLL